MAVGEHVGPQAWGAVWSECEPLSAWQANPCRMASAPGGMLAYAGRLYGAAGYGALVVRLYVAAGAYADIAAPAAARASLAVAGASGELLASFTVVVSLYSHRDATAAGLL